MSRAPGSRTPTAPDRIRLLSFVTDFRVGGTERQFVGLARALDPDRFEHHVACFRKMGDFLRELEGLRDLRLTEWTISRLYHPASLARQLRLAQYIRRNEIQVCHTYGFYPNLFGVPAARLGGAPVVLASIRDIGDHLTPTQRRLQRLVCRLADGVLVNAEAVRARLLSEGYDAGSIHLVHNGIVPPNDDAPADGEALRRGLGLPPGAPLVTLLGRLTPLKGGEFFLEAASLLAEGFPDVRFLVVGDGPGREDRSYRPVLQRHAARLGLSDRVVFTGLRGDVQAILRASAVSVLPSLSEGLSNVLLESMAAGVAVVATTVGGNPEIVEDGVTGLLVPPRDSAALARALDRLLQDEDARARLGRAGRERVASRFNLEKMVAETERLYLQLLRPSGSPLLGRREGISA